MAEQQDNRENITNITTVEEIAADGMKKRVVRKRARNPRVKNPLAEEEAIKTDDSHAD